VKIYLSGEGSDDLGDWYRPLQYRADPPVIGVIEALTRKVGACSTEVVGACIWKDIRKFTFKPSARGETQNVLRLVIEAEEAEADVLVFVRDQDGYDDRERDVEEGIRQAGERRYAVPIVGGVAVQEMEAWILALLGERKSEGHADAKRVLATRHDIEDLTEKVAAIEQADIAGIPEDAASLRLWMDRLNRQSPPAPDTAPPQSAAS
jgi:hypothetical protein